MPPEAFDGVRTEQGDLWAAGVVFQQLLTGGLPFPQADLTALMGAIVARDPVPLPATLPDGVHRFVAVALPKDPVRRFPTATAMRQALTRTLIHPLPLAAPGDAASGQGAETLPLRPATDGRAAAFTSAPTLFHPLSGSPPSGAAVTLLLGTTLFLALLIYFQGRAFQPAAPVANSPAPVAPPPAADAPPPADAPLPESLAPGSEGVYVIAFSAKTEEVAEAKRAAYAKAGFPAFVVKTDEWANFEPGFYIVTLGIYATEADAQVVMARIREQSLSAYAKRSGPPRPAPEAPPPPDEVPGDFPEAALRDLTEDELNGLSLEDLRLMRNEIMARHGYRFSDPELAEHFKAQPWYRPVSDNVGDKLTPLEKRNIERIRWAEKQAPNAHCGINAPGHRLLSPVKSRVGNPAPDAPRAYAERCAMPVGRDSVGAAWLAFKHDNKVAMSVARQGNAYAV